MAKSKFDKWKFIGYLLAITDPIIPGIVVGLALYTEKRYKKTGRNVIVLSIVLAVLYIWLIKAFLQP